MNRKAQCSVKNNTMMASILTSVNKRAIGVVIVDITFVHNRDEGRWTSISRGELLGNSISFPNIKIATHSPHSLSFFLSLPLSTLLRTSRPRCFYLSLPNLPLHLRQHEWPVTTKKGSRVKFFKLCWRPRCNLLTFVIRTYVAISKLTKWLFLEERWDPGLS